MRKLIAILFLIVVIGGAVFAFFYYRGEALPPGPRLYVGSAVVVVEIADDAKEMGRGLSGRESLGKYAGMLFMLSSPRKQSFWMKDMNFPLDFIFINEGRVVEIIKNIEAPKAGEDGRKILATPRLPAEWILEVNSGWAEKNGVKVGDAVHLDMEKES